jgi:enamine deaminase RidA (YjgF/YER057c/UK114 family)
MENDLKSILLYYTEMTTRIGGTKRYSDILIHNRIVYLSGIVPTCEGTLYTQTKEVLDILDSKLKCCGSSKNDILMMTIYLTDITNYDEMNVAYDEWVGKPPARATIGASLPNSIWKLEVAVTAAIPYVFESTNYGLHDINYIV